MQLGDGDVSPALLELLGPNLLSNSGSVPTATALANKSVALYFSAHWCPPCRSFTPMLAKAYKEHLKGKDLEIIFVSSDRDERAFASYHKEMPWLALPFGDRARKGGLGSRFGVQGIPCLVLIDAKGNLVTKDGRGKVMGDPTGKWVPRPPAPAPAKKAAPAAPRPAADTNVADLQGLLGGEVLATDGKTTVALADAVGKAPLVGLYFSAHWCGPCRAFTPKLVTFVEMLREDDIDFPIIFGSSDKDADAFASYFSEMPWNAFPHADARIETLKKKYAVSGIPWLVVLDANGNLVVNEADEDVPKGPQAYTEWLAKAEKMAAKPVAGAPAA